MPDHNTAISCAILMINDQEKKDYYDNFVPLIIECIRVSPKDIVSSTVIQTDLEKHFGLSIPISVIETILKRKLSKKNLLTLKDKKYIPNRELLDNFNFKELQVNVLENHDKLINEIITYVNNNFGESWSKSEAEKTLESFLHENHLVLFQNQIEINNIAKRHYMLAQFIRSLEQDSLTLSYLESVIKGNMLANAIYYTEPSHINMRFKSTEIYLDTSFIIYALGYSGKANQVPRLELLELLRSSGGIIRCFRHTVQEIIGILDSYQRRLQQGYIGVDSHGTMEHFLNMKYTSSDVERIIYGIENEIEKKLRISIVDKPPYDGSFKVHNIDEQGLSNVLEEKMLYKNKAALYRDVESISAIMRLRKSRFSMFVENCNAIFVTTNKSLAEISKRYLFPEYHSNRIIPPAIPDFVLTNLLWLKNPTKAPNLARKRIIADCFAAVRPQEHLWKKYIEKAEWLLKEGQITPNDYYTLRSSPEARSVLMEVTMGDEDVITLGSVEEILRKAKQAMVENVVQDYEEKLKKIEQESENAKLATISAVEEVEKSKMEVAAAISNQEKYFNNTARNRSLWIVRLLKVSIVLILCFGQSYAYVMLNYSPPLWIKSLVFLMFVIYFPVTGYIGVSLDKPFKNLEEMTYRFIRRKIESDFNKKITT